MSTRLSIAILGMIALGVGRHAEGSPITYDFAGTLASPFNGSNQFSGSFTINGDPTSFTTAFSTEGSVASAAGISTYNNEVNEGGGDVSLTVKMGGQVFNFVNQQSPDATATFTAGLADRWLAYQSPQDEASIIGTMTSANGSPGGSFEMSFYSDAASDRIDNLRGFSFPVGSSGVYVNVFSGNSSDYQGGGTVTSIELVPTPTPEPSTLAMFTVLGIAAMARLRRRACDRPGPAVQSSSSPVGSGLIGNRHSPSTL